MSVSDLQTAGLYDPSAPDAAARLALLEYLLSLGLSVPELVQAEEENRLTSIAAFRRIRPGEERITLAEASRRAGVSPDLALRLWRAFGFAEPISSDRRCSEHDVEALVLLAAFGELLGLEVAVQFARTLGETTARLAEAEVALMRANVEAPGYARGSPVDVARIYADIADDMLPRVVAVVDTLHRHHLESISRRYSDSAASPTQASVVDLAIGFADLSEYTSLSQDLDPLELGRMLAAFEETTGDAIAGAGGNVVKRIGDAVMYMTPAPGTACALALDILDACAANPLLPRVRIGVAFGPVVLLQGDAHGPVVNLAARLVDAAAPGTILAAPVLAERLRDLGGRLSFLPSGRYDLAGFEEPVTAFQLLRGEGSRGRTSKPG